ncbi:50S ribosomal protein L23 [Candidatus Nitrosoglobus terrae]|uniref:Large ribosomal subunit protein uL23 n=1 Tax=Candidatus Nitrosoglobus terrae TaxID=1630141 RepID=A0A1Q2SLM2_9GAMM|nr:50S ribosomal protein L23 [Candidatus Nitrosoglobus terrae]BAW80031.1 50S ribosomal protein L23 [Candidatus Nitrosoglobus terrae]
MSEERLAKIILAPLLSEKSSLVGEKYKQAVFKVLSSANKKEIKQAVEFLFNVKVDKVNTVSTKGKHKRFGRYIGRRSDWKKAYVVLHSGYDINFMNIE